MSRAQLFAIVALAGAAFFLFRSPDPAELMASCVPKEGVTPLCGFKNPEDAVVLPNGKIIVSQMGNLEESSPGSLVLFDVETRIHTPLFGHGYASDNLGDNSWGNVDCVDNPREFLSPHGISLLKRADDRLQLMVVNHGGRESVEFFEVLEDEKGISTVWRGCVKAENKEFFNAVAALPDGGFIVSSMYARKGPEIMGLHFGGYKALMGMDSGYLAEWHSWQEMSIVPGSAGAFPNGVLVSNDGRFVYQNLYGSDEVRKLDRRSGKVVASVEVVKPDNITFDDKGLLLVASQTVSVMELKSCVDKPEETCLLPFDIVQIDPETMTSKVVFTQEGPPMGAGTVAVQYKEHLLIGSFLGDRMLLTDYVDH